MFDAIADLECFRLSRFDDLSDVFGENLLLSFNDFRGCLELSFDIVLYNLLLLLAFPGNENSNNCIIY